MTLIRRPGVALVTLLFLLLGVAFITQVVPYRQIIDSQRQVTAAQESWPPSKRTTRSSRPSAALNTDEEIEKLARRSSGMSALGRPHMSFSIHPARTRSGRKKTCWWWTKNLVDRHLGILHRRRPRFRGMTLRRPSGRRDPDRAPATRRIEPGSRCHLGLPVVVRVPPILDDGTPFPTHYWLTCPLAVVGWRGSRGPGG